jgi:hypothetical protein
LIMECQWNDFIFDPCSVGISIDLWKLEETNLMKTENSTDRKMSHHVFQIS